MLKLLISCWYDGVVVACRYMFAMGSGVVLVLLLLYCDTCQRFLRHRHSFMPDSHVLLIFNEGSLFCVATRLLAEWSGVRISSGATITLFLTCSNRPGPTLSSILWVRGLTQTGREVDCSRSSIAEVQNECSYASPVMLSWCGQGHRDFALGINARLNSDIKLL